MRICKRRNQHRNIPILKSKVKFTKPQYDLFVQLQTIADIIYNSSSNPGVDQRIDAPDYQCVQSEGNILLEQSNILHTPWGKWEIASESSTVIFKEMDIKLDLFKEAKTTPFGYFHPLYIITHVNGEKITPIKPIDLCDKNNKHLKYLWKKMHEEMN